MRIVGLSGKAYSGKDWTGALIGSRLNHFRHFSLAAHLKYLYCGALGIPVESLENHKLNWLQLILRPVLFFLCNKILGTPKKFFYWHKEEHRNGLIFLAETIKETHPYYFMEKFKAEIDKTGHQYWYLTDVRYQVEYDWLANNFNEGEVFNVLIERPQNTYSKNCGFSIQDQQFHYKFINDGDPDKQNRFIDEIMYFAKDR